MQDLWAAQDARQGAVLHRVTRTLPHGELSDQARCGAIAAQWHPRAVREHSTLCATCVRASNARAA